MKRSALSLLERQLLKALKGVSDFDPADPHGEGWLAKDGWCWCDGQLQHDPDCRRARAAVAKAERVKSTQQSPKGAPQMEQKPSIGRTVHYKLSLEDAEKINRRRTTGGSIAERIADNKWPLGAQAHIGTEAKRAEVLPLIITAVAADDDHVSGQVLLNGNDTLWVDGVKFSGVHEGHWSWPPRV